MSSRFAAWDWLGAAAELHRIEQRITELQQASQSLGHGADAETVRKLLVSTSDMLRQHARAEQPRPDTTFQVSVCIERVVHEEGITEEMSKSVAEFATGEQANAYAAMLHSLGAVLAFNDSDQLKRYNWRV